MKAVVFYEPAAVSMETIMTVYPKHKAFVDQLASEGKIIAIGTYANPLEGSMAIFANKAAAEEFCANDPFVLEGIVAKFIIKEWNETLMN